ncbi:uncharacterized protein F4822DRAFT_97178 [Hypoxylon trugodes]|uniref:uncharacterized protein n=1 Tax=Hypoxylon trugodes TaxID=326681 RepID=UPI00219EA4D1|nr:uncharacterized protein F4822DRAFT_97178 [Hypoxylon trugodes]KAI1382797.1 hypothetical protein F4822DRAFT_97178 [Hypoxylon trugodes]
MAITVQRETKAHQQEDIPVYQTIAPSIFVPANMDLTKPPPDPPTDPIELSSETRAWIDRHADAVQDNIYYMLNREKTRIRRECQQHEYNLPRYLKAVPGLTEEEERALPDNSQELDEIFFIRSFCPEPKRGPYEVPPNFTHEHCQHIETAGRFGEPPRKSAEKMLMNLTKHGIMTLEALAQHVENEKDKKTKEIKSNAKSTTVSPEDMMEIDG